MVLVGYVAKEIEVLMAVSGDKFPTLSTNPRPQTTRCHSGIDTTARLTKSTFLILEVQLFTPKIWRLLDPRISLVFLASSGDQNSLGCALLDSLTLRLPAWRVSISMSSLLGGGSIR